MAKREVSSTLRNLKFMQRGVQREEKAKKLVEEEVKPDGSFNFPPTLNKKCMVIAEGDPQPGAVIGRMSFLSFNPSIDKLNEETRNPVRDAAVTSSSNHNGKMSFKENGSSQDGAECSRMMETDGDLKRKQPEVVSEPDYPNKSPKNFQGDEQSPRTQSKGFRKPKPGSVNWSVLRPPKAQKKTGKQ